MTLYMKESMFIEYIVHTQYTKSADLTCNVCDFLTTQTVGQSTIEIRSYISLFQTAKARLSPALCSGVSLVGNLISNMIFKSPLLPGSLAIGIPSLATTSS